MKTILQRVSRASVVVQGKTVGSIQNGILIFLGVHKDDKEDKIPKLADKITNLRIFSDKADKMNLSVTDIKGQILVVSQFTLYGDLYKGNRPGFNGAAEPEKARLFYDKFVQYLKDKGIDVKTGEFGASMRVSLINNGPVTFILEI
jgi:D-tyrosyl-tRNA(Tyr) deacylase